MPHTWGPLSCRERLLWEHLKVLPWPASPSDSRRYTVCLAEGIAGQQLPGMLLRIHTCQRRVTSPRDRFSWKASVMAHTNSCMFSTLFNTWYCCCSRQPFQPGLHSGGGALGGGVPVNMADGSLWSLGCTGRTWPVLPGIKGQLDMNPAAVCQHSVLQNLRGAETKLFIDVHYWHYSSCKRPPFSLRRHQFSFLYIFPDSSDLPSLSEGHETVTQRSPF